MGTSSSELRHKAPGPSEREPFVHTYRTETSRYAYDVNSARVLRINDVTDAILSNWGQPIGDMVAAANGRFTASEARVALDNINDARRQGIAFTGHRPNGAKTFYTREAVAEALSNDRNQLVLCASEACNLRCRYCHFTYGSSIRRVHRPRMMTWDVARKAIDQYLSHIGEAMRKYREQMASPSTELGTSRPHVPPPTVGFYGGEPLMNFDLVRRCIEYVRQSPDGEHMMINMTTNGTLLSRDVVAFLADNNVTLMISVDGPAVIHDRYRLFADGSGSFDTVRSNILDTKEHFPDYFARWILAATVAPPMDLRDLLAFFTESEMVPPPGNMLINMVTRDDPVEFWAELSDVDRRITGVQELWQEYYKRAVEGRLGLAGVSDDDEVKTTVFLRKVFDSRFAHAYLRSLDDVKNWGVTGLTHGMCIPGHRRTYVTVDGTFFPCERVPNEAGDLNIGNVEDEIGIDKVMHVLKSAIDVVSDLCCECWNIRTCAISCSGIVNGQGLISRDAVAAQCKLSRSATDWAFSAMSHILEKNPQGLSHLDAIADEL